MIAAFVVLLILALGLGGYIVYLEVSERRKVAYANEDESFERARNFIALQSANRTGTTHDSGVEYADRAVADSGAMLELAEIRESVSAQEVDRLMQDEVAAALIEKSDGTSDRTKTGIVNIDALSQYFESGETVTLDEVKKRVKGFDKNTTYLKVLARGTLDKALTVEADSFSLQAVKMIVLTGGTAVRKH